ncbi:MAG TPA: universal stress protein [Bryobacteraceae bacterium]|nr:universal stress protein [Bryobacteraceae bacterium]
MPRFHHILFPVDFSAQCRTVCPLVEAMVQQFHSKLTLMHVIQVPPGWYGGIDCGYPVVLDMPAMEASAKQELGSFFERSPVTPDRIVELGDAAFEITDFAEQNQVDLIMMPTHGHGKFRSLLLGSVTAKVLHDAKCFVWTAAHTEDPEVARHRECKSMMGAIDLTPASAVLIRHYAELARDFSAKLRLVHAVPGASSDIPYGQDRDFQAFLLQAARQEAAKLQSEAGTNFDVCMEAGLVSDVVRAAAEHHDADLVLIGRNTLQARLGQLRTNAYAILRNAPCPVLSV